ncbi:MAG TPA: alginate O-acetyltransferase AlgF [Stellaceae bacterium]|nr:alginate O-acetyltransferase AlgF [Stellaceae bacterium]
MSSIARPVFVLALCAALGVAATSNVRAAEGRLYPSGPPNGVAYLRFANLSAQPVKVKSAGGTLTLTTDGGHRVGEYDPVTPGSELTGTVDVGGKTAPIKLKLTQNELLTVVVTTGGDGAPLVTLVGDTPTEFNAQKAALALYNLDKGCKEATLEAGDGHAAVISGVAPDGVKRRLVNAVNVALAVACGAGGPGAVAKLGQMDAGERYSIFLYAAGAGLQALAVHDEMALLRP